MDLTFHPDLDDAFCDKLKERLSCIQHGKPLALVGEWDRWRTMWLTILRDPTKWTVLWQAEMTRKQRNLFWAERKESYDARQELGPVRVAWA